MDQPVSPKSEGQNKKIDKYEVDDAVRTLLRAEDIKSNKELMKLVGPELAKQHKNISKVRSIADIRARANAGDDESSEEKVDDESMEE